LKKTLDGQTARMKAIKQLYDSSATFQSLKPVYDIDRNFLFVGRSILSAVLCVKKILATRYGMLYG
jgi:hypothetical protein